ncbi:hypothetical protein AKJ16_DCAP03122 [Drosera capensis]
MVIENLLPAIVVEQSDTAEPNRFILLAVSDIVQDFAWTTSRIMCGVELVDGRHQRRGRVHCLAHCTFSEKIACGMDV